MKRVHWLAFAMAGTVCGVAGGIFAFAKGSISPETIGIGRSIDGLVMVLRLRWAQEEDDAAAEVTDRAGIDG